MNKTHAHKKTQIEIAQKFSTAIACIDVEHLTVDFSINIRLYKTCMASEITILDQNFNKFLIYLHSGTDIDQIVQDMTTKSYSELKTLYSSH